MQICSSQVPRDLTGREPGEPLCEASDKPLELWHGQPATNCLSYGTAYYMELQLFPS
jgi:hypothetical protein